MRNIRKRQRAENIRMNNYTYMFYFNQLLELAITRFKWNNLPATVDERWLEYNTNTQGATVFFKDEVMGFLGLPVALGGAFDVNQVPTERRAYASNGYQNPDLNASNSVIIYNNVLHDTSLMPLELFARRLYEIKRAIDVNIKGQKTPKIILSSESQRLTMVNLFEQYDGNEPFIYGDKSLDLSGIKSIDSSSPYVADKLNEQFVAEWNSALTYLGISNISFQKKERMVSDEVQRMQGGSIASQNAALASRQQAAEQINRMFGLNVSVDFAPGIAIRANGPEEPEIEMEEGDENE